MRRPGRLSVRQRVNVALFGVVTTAATLAASATGLYLPGDDPSTTQLVLAALASTLTGGLAATQAYREARGKTESRQMAQLTKEEEGGGRVFPLPPDVKDFTGREDVIVRLKGLLREGRRRRGTAVVISAIAGQGGVGKTTLAIHLAHTMREEFPDGYLYVNLRGVEDQVLDPAEVAAGFLRDLGVAGAAIPDDTAERIRMYRDRLHGRRMLILLDNAAEEAQVRPLLPGESTCSVLITSRRDLRALESATTVRLDVLDEPQSLDLLRRIVGAERVDAEPDAARTLVRLCGHLPLAIRIIGARLAGRSHTKLASFAVRLSDEHRLLDEMRVGDLEVRSSFELSHQGLPEKQQRVFELLSLLQVPDFPAWVAGPLAGVSPREAEELVDRLVDRNLLETIGREGDLDARYRFHDLLRLFGREKLAESTPQAAQKEALARLLDVYANYAVRADQGLSPSSANAERADDGSAGEWSAEAVGVAGHLANDSAAWLTGEEASLVVLVTQAHASELWRQTHALAEPLCDFFDRLSLWGPWVESYTRAVEAAQRSGDRRAEGYLRRGLGVAAWEQLDLDTADRHYAEALRIFHAIDQRRGIADVLFMAGNLQRYQGRYGEGEASLESSLASFRELGLPLQESMNLHSLAYLRRDQLRLEEAETLYTTCLERFRAAGERYWEAHSLHGLGDVLMDLGRAEESAACFSACDEIYRDVRHAFGVAHTLHSQAQLAIALGEYKDAARKLELCVPLFDRYGYRLGSAQAVYHLGEMHRKRGKPRAARDRYRECLPEIRKTRHPLSEARVLRSLSFVEHDLREQEEAERHNAEAEAIFQRIALPPRPLA
ncbi:ATP-binding protein [Sphaerisporangium viridialbum]|uniref:ATP-binding protein n=1 Tax=Sphaerisporangium viridialbum TaxID=46189 RepID=UPI003C733601